MRIEEKLTERPAGKIPIDIETTEGSLDRVDATILVSVKFLKVIVNQIARLRISHTCGSIVWTRIVALWPLDHSMGNEVQSRLDYSSWRYFLPALCAAAFTAIRFRVTL